MGIGENRMLASFFLETCLNHGIDFFTGVPDSLLKCLCNELYARYGSESDTHVVAHNEGGAIALCAGHYLASGRPGLCYMQNSGLGNAVNPLASLMDPEVYAIPCMLVIGWRGEPGIADEPQHIRQGRITVGQLELLDIPYRILSEETTDCVFTEDFEALCTEMNRGKTVAFLVRKGAFTSDAELSGNNHRPLSREEALGIILSFSGQKDVFVSTTGKLSRELFELRETRNECHSSDFLTVGSMGHAGMIALRIAIEKPDRRIWCLDGDGACLMHLGAFPLIGQRKPGNLIHVVMNNGAHETVGGMPVCGGTLDITALAEASGYPIVLSADSGQSLASVLEQSCNMKSGPVLIEIKCSCGSRNNLGRPTTTPAENKNGLMTFIQ